jgi:hypothetical protein
MSKMIQLVEELRDRLNSIADQEQKLVSSLRDALTRFDQKLLQDVRSIAAEHETRRSVILGELQGLASRMGAFPPPKADVRPSLNSEARPAVNGAAAESGPALPGAARLRAVDGGAWRDATDKLQTELDSYFRKRA